MLNFHEMHEFRRVPSYVPVKGETADQIIAQQKHGVAGSAQRLQSMINDENLAIALISFYLNKSWRSNYRIQGHF